MSEKKMLHMEVPKIPNEKAAADYFTSKYATKEPMRNWNWDYPKNHPEMHLVQELSRLDELENLIAGKRGIMRKKRKELDAGWKDLEEKEETLKESFIRFNRFVRENTEKRERALVKSNEQYHLRQQRQQDIEDLQEKMERLQETRKTMELKIRQYRIYESFLDSLTGTGGEFKNVNDIINRYESLLETKKRLAEKQETDLTALEHARTLMTKAVETNLLIIMGLNNRVADLNNRYGKAHRNCLDWEGIVNTVKINIIAKLYEAVAIRQNCRNVYVKMCQRKNNTPELHPLDTENQFVFIKKTLEDLRWLDEVIKKSSSMGASVRPTTSKAKKHKLNFA